MPKLTPVSWKYLVKRLNKMGFEGPYSGGKHPVKIDTIVVEAGHGGLATSIGVELLSRILKQARISRKEWLHN